MFVTAAAAFALYAGTGADAGTGSVRYTVSPGDTLWEIAVSHAPPHEDPRPLIEAIREANDLPGATIQPGMSLRIPPAE